jgi:hypothetical protein
MITQLRDLFGQLRGRIICRVSVGPAGVHYDFRPPLAQTREFFDYGILSNAAVTLRSKQKETLLALPPFPPFQSEKELQSFLLGKEVTNADIDEEKNAGRIILGDEILLSLIPTHGDDRVYWALYNWPLGYEVGGKTNGFVITASNIQRVKGHSTELPTQEHGSEP